MSNPIVEVKHLSHRYSVDWAIRDINFSIEKTGILGLLGSNGAGKSTTMNIICGVLNQTEGDVFINGIDLRKNPVEAKKHIGFLPQKPPLHPDLTVDEYLIHCATLRRMEKSKIREVVEIAKERCAIAHFSKRLIKNLSGGYQQRVGIAQALLNNPKILILDEPTAGLDPKERVRFRNLLSEYAGDKIVILSTHIVSDIEAIADEVLLMKKGKFVLQGTVPELIHKANGKVWELSVSPQEARQWQTKTTVANLRHEGKEIILRIISDNMPSERAVPCEATLEDLYLFYFSTEEGVK